jgi:hypothetical protein
VVSGIRVHDELFINGVRYYTQEQLDAAIKDAVDLAERRVWREAVEPRLGQDRYEQGRRDARRDALLEFVIDTKKVKRDEQERIMAAIQGCSAVRHPIVGDIFISSNEVIAAIKGVGR